jgi:HK97 family phage portal protein
MSLHSAAIGLRARVIDDIGTLDKPTQWLVNALGKYSSTSGISPTEKTTMNLSAIYDGMRLLAESEAQLPLKVYRKDRRGDNMVDTAHPAYYLLHSQANELMSAFDWRKYSAFCRMIYGNSFSVIERNAMDRPIALWPIQPWRVKIKIDGRELLYIVDNQLEFSSDQIIHRKGYTWDGYVGVPFLELAAQSVGHMLATEQFGSAFFGNGANMSGVLKTDKRLKDEAAVERVKFSFMRQVGGIGNAMGVGLLEEGMDFQQLGIEPEKAQFLGSRAFNITEVARWLNVPVPMLKEMGRATFSNLEQLDLQFVKYSLTPILVQGEQEYEHKLLYLNERKSGQYSIKHNVKALLRGDTKTQAEWYSMMHRTAAYNANDILRHEDEPTYEGGDKHFVHSGATPIESL